MPGIRPVAPFLKRMIQPLVRKGVWHWLRFAVLLAGGSWLGHLLSESKALTTLRYTLYSEQLKMQQRGQLYPQKVALVLLEDDDYWGPDFQARTPLKRDQLGSLLEKLNAAGANIIALDVDLRVPLPQTPEYEFPDYRAEDARLYQAVHQICRNGHHMVLASSVGYEDGNYAQLPSIYSEALAHEPCVTSGYIQLPYDMRRIPGSLALDNGKSLDSLSLAVTRIEDPVAYQTVAGATGDQGFRFSQYLTEADFAPRDGRQFLFKGTDVRAMTPAQLHAQLGDRIVLIGAKWHANAYGSGPYVDTHASPGGSEPGVMLHANYVEAMLDRTGTFAPISDRTAEAIEIALALVLAIIGALEIHSGWKWGAFVGGTLFCVILTYFLLQNLGLFLDFAIPLFMLFAHTIMEKAIEIWTEWKESRSATHGAHP
jgi:CHASE2 domain-containing sensor protein